MSCLHHDLKRMFCLAEPSPKSVVREESKAAGQVVDQPYDSDSRTITVTPGQAFPGDNRSSSGQGLGDGLVSHTAKWLQVRCRQRVSHNQVVCLIISTCLLRVSDKGLKQMCMIMQEDGGFDGNLKSPMEFIHEAPPIKVHGAVVASFGCETSPGTREPAPYCPHSCLLLVSTSK